MGQSSRRLIIGRAEPHFDIDYAYGHKSEIKLATLLEDLADGNGRVEVKRKRIHDAKFYVETHCDKGRRGLYQPSGILVTKAEVWAIVFADSGINLLVPTFELRALLDDPSTVDKREDDGSCPTRGKLVDLTVLLYRHRQLRPTPTPESPARRDVPSAPKRYYQQLLDYLGRRP